MKILVTGANGFVGGAVTRHLNTMAGVHPRAATRRAASNLTNDIEHIKVDALGPDTDWQAAVANIDVVVHTAARVHVMAETASNPLTEFRKTNVEGTLNLARQAAASGVKRFIFVSSIKVNGEMTAPGHPFTADQEPAPIDPYGISKMEAEQGLAVIGNETNMEIVIIRPVLVYGPGVKANFLNMMTWLKRGMPLPLGAIHNRRSLVALDNLVDLIVKTLDHPAAANQTFLVSDGEDLSTTDLLRRLGTALGKPPLLIPLPAWMLHSAASLVGKSNISQRLCGSLQVDIKKNHKLLNWTPPLQVDQALQKVAAHFLK